MKKFATDPPRRDECAFWKTWSNQRFCRELLISVPANAVSKSDKKDVEEKVMLWQHTSFARLRITTRLRHPSLNRQEAKNY
jgi:hypothetical protein